MKTARTLLMCIIALALIFPAFAQERAVNFNNLPENIKYVPGLKEAVKDLKSSVNYMHVPEVQAYYGKEFNPKFHQATNKKVVNNDQILSNPAGLILGTCWYDQQAHGNMPRHITTFIDPPSNFYFNIAAIGSASGNAGKADFVPFGTTMPTYASLGTYYGFLDFTGNELKPSETWNRIEKFPSYTGSLFSFKEGNVGVSSNLFPLQLKSLQLTSNADIGGSDFVVDSIPGTITFFPRSVADGQNNVHTIFSHRITGEPEFDQIGYKKGANGGKNWDPEIIMTGPNALGGALPTAATFETYAIDAEGNTVVFAYIDKYLNFIYRKSKDNGTTWSQPYLLWQPAYDTLFTKKDSSGTYYGWTDSSTMSPGLIMDATVDANGDFDFVVNVMISCHVGEVKKNSQNQWAWVAGTDSVVWGKKYYPKIGFLYIHVPADSTVQPTMVLGAPPSDGDFTPQQSTYVPFSYTHVSLNDSMPGTFCVADPQIGYDVDGNVYLTYTSIRDSINLAMQPDAKPLVHSQTGDQYSFYNRHIFVTKFDKVAKSFSKPFSLSPNGWDCGYGSLAKKIVKKNGEVRFPLVYTADTEPTNWIGFNRIFNFISEPKLYAYSFKMSDYSNLAIGVNEEKDLTASVSVFPNPVSEIAYINFANPKSGSLKVELYNMLGQKAATVFNGFADAGVQSFSLDAATLINGTYICKVTANGSSYTQTLVVGK